METIKYCSKNDKLGTKQVYQDIKEQFSEIDQQRKGCLSECKTCRRQPFAKIGKKQLVCGDSPEHLYKQLTAIISQSASYPTAEKKPKSGKFADSALIHYTFNSQDKNELTISLDMNSAAKLAKKLKALQQSGELRKMKAIRSKKTSSIKAKLILAMAEGNKDQLKRKKNTLKLHLTAHTLQELQAILIRYMQKGELSTSHSYTLQQSGSSEEVQLHLVALKSMQHAITG
ncbi:DUF1450 domain-containing protein [Paenibacillus dauci]|uniref:DUF1450 domain-containing protein n=1 Tax=Paenibacillus dauci TaxID=1567106 RepID=UPI000698F075|nr:DUF1450 domain-containing protein [Paenibacillus dauci]